MRTISMAKKLLSVATLLACAGGAAAQSNEWHPKVTMVRTGWNDDSFAVVTAEPIKNPAGCPTADGYISHISFPGYSTYYAAALSAYVTQRPVIIAVHDTECFAGRPKLIGINLASH